MIPIRNVYYMLSYAFQVLHGQGYKNLGTEDFASAGDLFAAILCRGVELQLKQGLGKAYIEQTEPLASLRGRIQMTESMTAMTIQRKQLICTYEVFSEDSEMNRILKSTLILLLHAQIAKERKKRIRSILIALARIGSRSGRST